MPVSSRDVEADADLPGDLLERPGQLAADHVDRVVLNELADVACAHREVANRVVGAPARDQVIRRDDVVDVPAALALELVQLRAVLVGRSCIQPLIRVARDVEDLGLGHAALDQPTRPAAIGTDPEHRVPRALEANCELMGDERAVCTWNESYTHDEG